MTRKNKLNHKNDLYHFDIAMYPRHLWVTYNADYDMLDKQFFITAEGFNWDSIIMECNDAYAIPVIENESTASGYLIVFASKDEMTPWIISHEAVHVANFVYNDIGASIDLDNDEPYAYLVEYIVKCCDSIK